MPQQLTIPSRTENLREVRDFVAGLARDVGFEEDIVGMIALAVDEACTNIIKHGYRYAADKQIEIHVETSNGTFEISIVDEGKSFDPSVIHSPNMKDYLTHYRHGGLGLHLMRSLMDNVDYKTSGTRNVVRMIKRIPHRKTA